MEMNIKEVFIFLKIIHSLFRAVVPLMLLVIMALVLEVLTIDMVVTSLLLAVQ